MQVELLNYKLQKEFLENRNSLTLERYVMSELMSPIEDYYHAIHIIEQNQDIIEGYSLYYIAAYLCAEWSPENGVFLEKLNGILEHAKEEDKAIIYYLNAHYLSFVMKNWRYSEKYKFYLQQSVEHSTGIRFVYNRLDLAHVLSGEEAQRYRKEARSNIVEILTDEEIDHIAEEEWLNSQRFINEYILGTHINSHVFAQNFVEL